MANHWMTELKEMIVDYFRQMNVRVYLFGSRAKQMEKHSSDVDIAIDSAGVDIAYSLTCLRERLEESTFPYHVDIVDMNHAAASLCRRIREEGIIWKDFTNESR